MNIIYFFFVVFYLSLIRPTRQDMRAGGKIGGQPLQRNRLVEAYVGDYDSCALPLRNEACFVSSAREQHYLPAHRLDAFRTHPDWPRSRVCLCLSPAVFAHIDRCEDILIRFLPFFLSLSLSLFISLPHQSSLTVRSSSGVVIIDRIKYKEKREMCGEDIARDESMWVMFVSWCDIIHPMEYITRVSTHTNTFHVVTSKSRQGRHKKRRDMRGETTLRVVLTHYALLKVCQRLANTHWTGLGGLSVLCLCV